MKYIISLFQSIWKGLTDALAWVIGAPALIISSITGIATSVKTTYDSLTVGTSVIDPVINATSGSIDSLSQYLNDLPDIIKIGLYCLSFDVLFNFVISTFGLILTLFIATLTFFLVTIPVYFLTIISAKWFARLICSIMPSGYVPIMINVIADYQPPNPLSYGYKLVANFQSKLDA